jgi:hypothetical protein
LQSLDFSAIRKLNGNKPPEAIYLVCKSGTFDFPLNTTGETTIDAKTAQSLDQGKVFDGFEKGGHAILGIGSDTRHCATNFPERLL